MSVFDFFRKIFAGRRESTPNQADSEFRNDFRNPIWDTNEGDDSDNDFRNHGNFFSFNVYTNPLEIHRYFEQQMNEMLKNFHMLEPFQEFSSFFNSDFNENEFPMIEQSPLDQFSQQFPAIEGPNESQKSLREHLLKPEFRSIESPSDKVDTILDGEVDTKDICRALEKKDSPIPIWTPNDSAKSLVPNRDTFSFSSGRSVVTRFVRRADGSTEREEIVKDSDGTETKTVTRSLGDHEYSVTTIKDALGVEKRTENYKNIDPGRLEEFNKAWDIHGSKWWSWWSDRKPGF
ncbi:uncharacterized protein LOC142319681 [Lycorma delicatula]|uniref:uncharacterized protein LOC142319681 n=1 Tax=Lycorma delicatula TaxID=130591 RepID=UPI003F50EDB3